MTSQVLGSVGVGHGALISWQRERGRQAIDGTDFLGACRANGKLAMADSGRPLLAVQALPRVPPGRRDRKLDDLRPQARPPVARSARRRCEDEQRDRLGLVDLQVVACPL